MANQQSGGGLGPSLILGGIMLVPLGLMWEMSFFIAIGAIFLIIGILIVVVSSSEKTVKHNQSVKNLSDVHGTARLATDADIGHLMQSNKGIYIGGKKVFFQEQGHLLTVAGARSGKGVNLIIPNLLGASNYEGSWVIIDPKGELTAITADYQQQAGRKVYILDPFKELKKQASRNPRHSFLADLSFGHFNPLDVLDPEDENLTDDVEVIAEMIVPLSKGEDSHWTDRARSLIAGLLLHMMTSQTKEKRTFFKLYEWLRLTQVDWIMLIQEMQRSDAVYGVVRSQGNEIISLMETSEKEFGGIISTTRRYTDIFKSPALIRSMATSDFDINQIAHERIALYLILPSDKLESHRTWLRLCLRMSLTAVMRNKGHRVTFLMDEFHSLGHLKVIEKSMGRLPGYNVTLWPILQDLNQLKSLYKDSWETFLANSRVRHFFGVGDNFTAEYVSKRMGDTTIVTWQNQNASTTYNSSKRSLMTPNEISASPKIITFIDSLPVARFEKAPYYEWEQLNERAKPNPYYKD